MTQLGILCHQESFRHNRTDTHMYSQTRPCAQPVQTRQNSQHYKEEVDTRCIPSPRSYLQSMLICEGNASFLQWRVTGPIEHILEQASVVGQNKTDSTFFGFGVSFCVPTFFCFVSFMVFWVGGCFILV